jgi:phenylpropionate dioxygenase-like ring-hydroxylating dioxygenase large terminal subunit
MPSKRRESPIDAAKARAAAASVDARHGLVGRDIFVDDETYQLELKQIFARCWLYLAHESQLTKPGDYVLVNMAEESVIVAKHKDGKVRAFINSCRHRGNSVCRADAGNTKMFVCPYHGWSYDTAGKLAGVPSYENLYQKALKWEDWGLTPVAQVDSYHGLIFGTFDPEAPPLGAYLGDVRWGLDLMLDQGDFGVVPGVARWMMDCNWKFAADNAIGDMYHGGFTHRSAVLAGHSLGTGSKLTDNGKLIPHDNRVRKGITVVTEYGHGFNANFAREGEIDLTAPLAKWRTDPAIRKKLGATRMNIGRANMNVFPNLFVNSGSRELMLRNPLGPTRTEIWKIVLVDRSAPPEVQRAQVRASNRHFGPGGMFEQDDGENWTESTLGARSPIARQAPLNYAMGLGKGAIVKGAKGEPPRIETLVNEHAQLWFYRCWGEYLTAKNWKTLKKSHLKPKGRL